MPVVDAPQIESEHGLPHGLLALAVLALPQLGASVVEARVLSWAMRGDGRRWIAGAQLVIAACALAGAVAPSPFVLGAALAVASPASGVSCGLAISTLVESSAHPERTMTRVTLAGALGDLTAPILAATLGALALPWQAALVAVAVIVLAHALATATLPRCPTEAPAHDDEAVGLREALRAPRLVWWLLGLVTCALLDEILVALSALRMRQDLGASEAATATALAAWAAGCTVGLIGTDRLLARFEPRHVIRVACVICAAAVAAVAIAPTPPLAGAALFVLGVTGAPLYPIAEAQAYAACPGRAVLVAIVAQVFVPLEIALPFALGLLADATGLGATLAALALQPVVLFLLAWLAWPPRGGPGGAGRAGPPPLMEPCVDERSR